VLIPLTGSGTRGDQEDNARYFEERGAAGVLSLPIIFWQFWLFVAPGLYDNEKKYVIPFVSGASIMFFLGAAFCYFFVIPVAFNFLINFGAEQFTAMPKIGEYVGFFTKLVVAFGISFELPVVTTRVGHLATVVLQDVDGLLVPPGDPDAFADALATLVQDPALRLSMGRRGRQRIVAEHSWDAVIARILAMADAAMPDSPVI